MGIGDEIMVTGEVRRLARKGDRFAIWDRKRIPSHRWHPIWAHNPYIAPPGEWYNRTLENCGGLRPYIESKSSDRWCWKEFTPTAGELYLTPQEIRYADYGGGAVVINPTIKPGASPNKFWPHWQALVDRAPHIRWLQLLQPGTRALHGVETVFTPDFRHACGVMLGARAAVLHEGGLHHAAAALSLPAVVIYGGFISPACTGYNTHRNLFVPSNSYPLGCGMRRLCAHCQRAMDSLTPDYVLSQLEQILCQ